MSKNIRNTPSTFLRTQSYIVNGIPNPLSNISRKKFFSKYIKKYIVRQNIKKNTKLNSDKNKNYIIEIKKLKKKKPSSSKKFNNFQKNIKNQEEENKEINNFCQTSKDLLNNTIKSKQNTINKSYNKEKECIMNETEKENYKDINNVNKKKKIFFINKFKNKKNNLPKFTYNLTNINNITKKKLHENEKNNNISDISNLIGNFYNNRILSEARMNFTKINDYDNNINIIYNSTYSEKLKKNKKIIKSIHKDRIFTTNNENKTKEKIKLMKKSFNKMTLFKFNNITKYNYSVNKINVIDTNKNKNKIYNYTNINNAIRNKINSFTVINSPIFNRNNNFYPVLTDYNIDNNKKDFLKQDKNIFCKSLSNAIFRMRDKRKTNQFIKDLDIKFKNFNSNNINTFSFNKEIDDEINDDFYSPLKNRLINSKRNNINFEKNYNKKKKINSFIKKNCSYDNFKRDYSKRKLFKSNKNIINNKLFIHINYNIDGRIMPANQA